MKTSRWAFVTVVLTAGFVSAAEPSLEPASPSTPKPAEAKAKSAVPGQYPVIGHLEKRGRVITIKAGPKGPLYSVKTAEGKVIFENLSAEQIRAQVPELHEFIKTAVASSSGKDRAVVDASLRMERR